MKKKSAREIAIDTLIAGRKDCAWSDGYLKAAIRKAGLDSRDAALATHLGYGVLQNRMLLDFYIGCYCSQKPERLEPIVLDVLRLGAYQILFLDRVPDSAAVNEAVELIRHYERDRAAGLVNAVLRKIADNKAHLPPIPREDPVEYLSIRYSHPAWLVRRCIAILGQEEAEDFLRCNNAAVATTVQVNPLRGSEEELLALLEQSGVQAEHHAWLPGCYTLRKTGNLEQMEAFRQGRFLVQDAAAKVAAAAAGVQSGMKVLDICAAPGGKSFAMAMEMGDTGEIRSFDLHRSKIRLIREGAERLGIHCIAAECGDGKEFRPELEAAADVVLCDVPCSGLGIIRKKPDIRYKSEKELQGIPRVQWAILENASRYVKAGGTLVYSTCTILPEENERLTDAFLAKHPEFERVAFDLPAPCGTIAQGEITLWPQRQDTDGFYICKMRKRDKTRPKRMAKEEILL